VIASIDAVSGIGDYVSLAKPRITALVAFTTASGLWLAPIRPRLTIVLLTLLGTVLAVASANVLNMYLERDTDALMSRTKHRPLPARRMDPQLALWFGLLLGAVSLPLLSLAVGPRPGLLAAIALVSYVLLYTPMKRRSSAALLVGAVAGAMPPLIGWTAATGTLDLPGVLLFAVIFLWQVPHFLAITLFRREDYARAGLLVLPNEPDGERKARRNIVCYTVALVSVSLLFVPLGVARNLYFATALFAGALFVAHGLNGLRPATGPRWARKEFALSLAYLTVLLGALVIDHAGVVRRS
jgi:protoheme IX farnesyltransferase